MWPGAMVKSLDLMLTEWELWEGVPCACASHVSLQQAGAIKTPVTGTSMPAGKGQRCQWELTCLACSCPTDPLSAGTVSGNVIVNTIAGVPAATFQSINKRLASPVAPGALTVSCLLLGGQ